MGFLHCLIENRCVDSNYTENHSVQVKEEDPFLRVSFKCIE